MGGTGFSFGTENREGQLKKTLYYISTYLWLQRLNNAICLITKWNLNFKSEDAGKSKKKVDDDIFLPALLLTAMASANTEHEPNHYVNVFISMMVAPVDNGVKQ